MIHLAFCLSTGTSWLGFKTTKCRVLVIQSEQTELNYAARLTDWVRTHKINPGAVKDLRFINEPGLRMDSTHWQFFIEEEVKEFRPDVIIVDDLYKSIISEVDYSSLSKYINFSFYLRQSYGVSIVTVHHPRKEDRFSENHGWENRNGLDELSGYAILNRDVETVIRVWHTDKEHDKTLLLLQWQKTRNVKGELGDFYVRWNPIRMAFDRTI